MLEFWYVYHRLPRLLKAVFLVFAIMFVIQSLIHTTQVFRYIIARNNHVHTSSHPH